MKASSTAATIDEYIAALPEGSAAILEKIRQIVRKAAPQAEEKISYRMPAFAMKGGILIYFAAFKAHIGIFPPLRGDEKLEAALAPYRGEKGNLKFPLDRPIPYTLIGRFVKSRMKAQARQAAAKRGKE